MTGVAGGPVRVAYVIGELGKGGAEYQLYELVRGLDPSRLAPAVLAGGAGGSWAQPLRQLGIPVQELAARGSADVGRLLRLRKALKALGPPLPPTTLWAGDPLGPA